MPQQITILGLGWLGLPLAKVLFDKGHEITGSTRSAEKLMRLLRSKYSIRIIKASKNTVEGNWKNFIKGTDVLVLNLPPDSKNRKEEDYPMVIDQIAQRCDPKTKVVFISSTSVYGETNEIVTEETTPQPSKKSGSAVLAAEKVIQDYFGENATILRFAGLCGEDRHPVRSISGNKLKNPSGKINLIHLNDCISLITNVIEKNHFGDIINGCADEHPTREDFYTKACFELGIPQPHFETGGEENWKIVSNEKSKRIFAINYLNPNDFLTHP